MNLEKYQQSISRLEGQHKAHQTQYDSTVGQLAQLKVAQEAAEKALVLAQTVAQQTQQELEFRISDIVTSSLASVFDDPYEFKVRFDIKRGKTEAALLFTRDGMEIDPMTASGGGVIDIATFALRIACYLISSPRPAPVMLFDEPSKYLSERYRSSFADLLTNMSSKLGIQFIFVTHCPDYEVGNIITL